MVQPIDPNLTAAEIDVLTFSYESHVGRDIDGHAHPADPHIAHQTMLRIQTSAGVDGYCAGASASAAEVARRIHVGVNPQDRVAFSDHKIGVIDQAL
ncbi:MAG: hypothetical protein EA415_08785 [Sphaerobacteraceae bacterium]|nr:MAG: hypothetical protein EA415_08785 [Sphaerobacteraceae bacterium]